MAGRLDQFSQDAKNDLSTSRSEDQLDQLDQNDPRHPYQWPQIRKWTHVIIFSTIEFVTPLASMMFAPVVPQVARAIGHDEITRTTLAVSIYVLGFIVGPLVFGPLSQLYGRMIVYRMTVVIYLCMSVGCALSTSIAMLTAFRFFGGCFGAAPIVIGGAAVADMFPVERRGRPLAVYSVGPFLGLTTGPIFGGLIDYYSSWRWIFWSLSIAAGILSVCTFAILRETHAPTILRHLQNPHSAPWLFKSVPITKPSSPVTPKNHLLQVLLPAFYSPIRITFSTPLLFLLFVSNALFTGIMNILFTTLGATYQSRYHFSTRSAGLAYLGIGTGGLIAAIILGKTSDKLGAFLSKRCTPSPFTSGPTISSASTDQARYRLPPIILGALLTSTGLLWYGWTLQSHTAWPVPLLGTFVFGLGMLAIQAGFPTYLLHAYSDQAGAVLSASIVTRSIGGSTVTLAGPTLNRRLGYGWASTLLAAVNLIFLVPAVMLYVRLGRARGGASSSEGREERGEGQEQEQSTP
jgi:multidrug resistance protein